MQAFHCGERNLLSATHFSDAVAEQPLMVGIIASSKMFQVSQRKKTIFPVHFVDNPFDLYCTHGKHYTFRP